MDSDAVKNMEASWSFYKNCPILIDSVSMIVGCTAVYLVFVAEA
jgi:hypothetical protein